MSTSLQSWQRSTIRNSMARYRRAQEDYYVSGKPLVELPDGSQAFSLVSPPLGSPAARRRIRRIVHQTMFASIAYPCVAEGCPAAMVQMHLRANGDVSPCDFTPHSFGNIRRQSLGDIWVAMTKSPLYAVPSARCRLSRPAFWAELDRTAGQ